MLDVSVVHAFETCAGFAVRWLGRIAAYDLAGAEALIDVNQSGIPFAQSFPPPQGFAYCDPDRMTDWTMHIEGADERGFHLDFEIRFVEREYRAMMAQFYMRRVGNQLEVQFIGLIPS